MHLRVVFLVTLCSFFPLSAYALSTKAQTDLLNQYYQARVKQPVQAERILTSLVDQAPDNLVAQKELGYLLIAKKEPAAALPHFLAAQKLDPTDYTLAAQIGYIYDGLGEHKKAYKEFVIAAQSSDSKLQENSQQAMINLAGLKTQYLPSPYFADVYFAPYYYQRFNDTIFPLQVRFGMTYGSQQQGELYIKSSTSVDNHSVGGMSPVIYSDNATVLAVGANYRPVASWPVYVYMELGKAYNFIKQDGVTWQNDLRGGINAYDKWGSGAVPNYAATLRSPLKYWGEVYFDGSYYSRFQHDWIGQLRVRNGLNLMQYHNSSIDGYVGAQVLQDSQRLFYNNLFEYGPGLAFTPDNHYNLTLRTEYIRGMYLINTDNPNSRDYVNRVVTLETYMRF